MALLQRGQRLSVQPVTPAHWRHVLKLAGIADAPL
jgi:predicted RNA-binding protein with PUA-like domain